MNRQPMILLCAYFACSAIYCYILYLIAHRKSGVLSPKTFHVVAVMGRVIRFIMILNGAWLGLFFSFVLLFNFLPSEWLRNTFVFKSAETILVALALTKVAIIMVTAGYLLLALIHFLLKPVNANFREYS